MKPQGETTCGRVVAVERNLYQVDTPLGRIGCRPRGRIARAARSAPGGRTTAPVVVGDRVQVRPAAEPGGRGVIEAVLPRATTVSRRATGPIPKEQILAANIDVAVAIVSLRQPRLKLGTVSQFVAGARSGGAEPAIVVNKVDLGPPGEAAAALGPFRDAGVRCVETSAVRGCGLDELRELLAGRWSLFYGQSGVGKSSLLNALCPEAAARVGEVSADGNKGRHTTTSSRLYELPGGGYVIDTPGIKAFWFCAAPVQDELDELFPEIAGLADGCRFRDCSHGPEPDCAVVAALEAGEIDEARYKHYVRLARSARRREAAAAKVKRR